jgi:tripartite-type tricarboxylate transporter receptor subunit TctC
VLVVNPALPIRSVSDLVNAAKARPGQMSYASAGSGSTTQFAMELFKRITGTDILHVPYRGAEPGGVDVMGGRIEMTLLGVATAKPLSDAGRLRILAVTSAERSAALPDVPTVRETIPEYQAENWFGIVMPRATPEAVIDHIRSAVEAALRADEVRQALRNQGLEPVGSTPAQFGDVIRRDLERYREIATQAGFTVE